MTDMGNRQQRRSRRARPRAVPRAMTPMPAAMGDVRRQLPEPVHVGDLTAAEAAEIRAVNALVKTWDEELERLRKTNTAVRLYRESILDKVIESRGLDKRNAYNLDDETGGIRMTHEVVEPEPGVLEIMPEEAPADEPAAEPEKTEKE
jgi:hypothetical protein